VKLNKDLTLILSKGISRFHVLTWRPSQTAPVIVQYTGKRILDSYRWGLIPGWSKDEKIGYKMMINARIETIFEKSTDFVNPLINIALICQRTMIPN